MPADRGRLRRDRSGQSCGGDQDDQDAGRRIRRRRIVHSLPGEYAVSVAERRAAPVPAAASKARAPSLETIGMTKIFGPLVALDDVSLAVESGAFHALLGENGAGKSTLVKCIMGFYSPDQGHVRLNGKEVVIRNPRDARALGIGMVYQHFTLVPSLTGAENLVISRADAPAVIDWKKERRALEEFLDRMPFRVRLDVPVSTLAAGEKQKLEILKLLYLDQRLLILDEPTSVLTPGEADDMLGLLKGMAARKEITVIMITHKFREVLAFADSVTVLRRGRQVGGGNVSDLTTDAMARMMIGDTPIRDRALRADRPPGEVVLEIAALFADDDDGLPALERVNLKVRAGEIVGIAGVSGNGQSQLVEVLSGQRPLADGRILIKREPFEPTRERFYELKIFGLPEEPLRNAAVPRMTVAENMAFRTFDRPPTAKLGWWLSGGPMRAKARELSGDVDVLIVANPCFGLDFASVAEIRSQIMEQRNRGAAVLLVSEDLDEILELADRVAVMSEGTINYVSPVGETDRATIGKYMAGH